jgi:tetratricopeptide (TPR) repeat protein
VAVRAVPSEQADALAQRFDRWRRQVSEASWVHEGIFKDLNEMGNKPGVTRDKIIERAREGLKRTAEDFDSLSAEKQAIIDEAAKHRPDPKQHGEVIEKYRAEMQRQDRVLAYLKDGRKALTDYLEKQEGLFKEESSPERKSAQAQLIDAEFAEQNADFDKAIDLYKKALGVIQDERRKKHLEELEAQWAISDDEHRKARRFVYETWPQLDTPGLERVMGERGEARRALDEFRRVGDRLSPQKLVRAANTHVVRLNKEATELNTTVNEQDAKPAERIKKIVPELTQLIADAIDFVDPNKKGGR